jgi:Autoinducer binding domain
MTFVFVGLSLKTGGSREKAARGEGRASLLRRDARADVGGVVLRSVPGNGRPIRNNAFACGEIDLADRDRSVMFVAEWPKAWIRFYVKSGFIKRDPVLNAVTLFRKPFLFRDIVHDTRFSSLEREAVRAAADHGWTQGLACRSRGVAPGSDSSR